MSNTNLQLALEIALRTQNLKDLDLLTDELRAAGVDVSNLAEKSEQLNTTFGTLSRKKELIEQFRDLKKATADANESWQQATSATADFAQQMDDAKERAEALGLALQNSAGLSAEETKATREEYKATLQEIKNIEQAQTVQAAKAAQLKSQYESLNNELSNTRSAMHEVGLATTGLNAQQQALAQESFSAQESLAQLTAEAEHLNELAQARITLGIDTDDAALAQIEAVTAAYETLRNSGTLSQDELARATQAHTERVAELEASLAEATPTLEAVAEEFGKVTAAAGGLAYVSNAAMQFETSMSAVKKVVDGTPEQIADLSTQIQRMAVEMGIGTDAVAEMAALGGQLGIPIEKLGEFTELAGKMSVAFGMSADEAGDAAAKLSNVFDIPIEQVNGLGDAINTLGNNTAAKEPEIVDAMLRIGGNAKQFGLAEEQAAALSATMISLGKSPEVAATAINALLTKLQTANVQSDDFQAALAGIGISANQMAADITANPQQALSDFLTTLAEMDSQQRSIVSFKLFGQEYVDDINALVGGVNTYNQALSLVVDKTANAGAMQREFEAKLDTSAQAIEQAKTSITVLAQTIGKELLPVVSLGAKAVDGIATAVTSFAESHPYLTKLAVLLAGGQVAMIALTSAMTLAGMAGLGAGTGMLTGFTRGAGAVNLATAALARLDIALATTGAAIRSTANSMDTLQASNRTLAGDMKGFAGHMMTLNGLFAAAAGWTIGNELGKSFYENSSAVRSIGDELGRVLAYLDAIATTRTFDDVNTHFQTAAESARQATAAEKAHADSIQGKAEAILKADAVVQQGQQTNDQLVQSLRATEEVNKSLITQMGILQATGQANTAQYQSLATQLEQNTQKLDVLKAAHEAAGGAADEQAVSNTALINEVKITEANIVSLTNKLAEMESQGQSGSAAHKALGNELENTRAKLEYLNIEVSKRGIGDALKTELDKASEAFQALGLDASEFATGIDSKTTAALSAFVDIARLADGDTRKLGLAYNAATDAAGDNAAAQAMLEQKLIQVTGGNQQLAAAVKQAADAQRDAKSASEQQAAALDKLGVSIAAANQGMSKSGLEMVQNLKAGVVAIKEQATSATALKSALSQAFDTSISAAKTIGDFREIQKTLQETGMASRLTADQLKIMEAGLKGGAQAAQQARQSLSTVSSAASTIKPPVDQATSAMRNLGSEADNTGRKMVNAAKDGNKEFEKLKKTVDDKGRVLNKDGEVMRAVNYTADSAYKKLLEELNVREEELTQREQNMLKSKASDAASSKRHLADPYKYGMTNAMEANSILEEFVKANKDRDWGEKAQQQSAPPPIPTSAPRPPPVPQTSIPTNTTPAVTPISINPNTTIQSLLASFDARTRALIEEHAVQVVMQRLQDAAKSRAI